MDGPPAANETCARAVRRSPDFRRRTGRRMTEGTRAMSSSDWNPNDLPVLRVELARIRGELKRIDSRVSQLEKVADRAVEAQLQTPAPPRPIIAPPSAPPVTAKPVVPPPIPQYSPLEPARALEAAAFEAKPDTPAASPPPLSARVAELPREEFHRPPEKRPQETLDHYDVSAAA